MTSGIESKGADLDNIFALYQSGTHPPATGIRVNGVDIATRYQPLPGTAAAATGIRTNGADLNTLFSKTASSALPIDGQTFNALVTVSSGSKASSIAFGITGGNTYQVTGSTNSGTEVMATGPVPTGAATVQYTLGSPTVPSGATDAGGAATNGASSRTPVSANPGASYLTSSWTSSSGTKAREYPLTIDFFNSAGANISHTVINLEATVEPAV